MIDFKKKVSQFSGWASAKVSQFSGWASAKVSAVVVIASASVLSVPAHAAAIDVSAIVTDIGAQAAPIGLIGGAVLLIFVAVKAFRWVRGALS